jgi:hypothetical protein
VQRWMGARELCDGVLYYTSCVFGTSTVQMRER